MQMTLAYEVYVGYNFTSMLRELLTVYFVWIMSNNMYMETRSFCHVIDAMGFIMP